MEQTLKNLPMLEQKEALRFLADYSVCRCNFKLDTRIYQKDRTNSFLKKISDSTHKILISIVYLCKKINRKILWL